MGGGVGFVRGVSGGPTARGTVAPTRGQVPGRVRDQYWFVVKSGGRRPPRASQGLPGPPLRSSQGLPKPLKASQSSPGDGLFGKGTYLAQDAAKIDQYLKQDLEWRGNKPDHELQKLYEVGVKHATYVCIQDLQRTQMKRCCC